MYHSAGVRVAYAAPVLRRRIISGTEAALCRTRIGSVLVPTRRLMRALGEGPAGADPPVSTVCAKRGDPQGVASDGASETRGSAAHAGAVVTACGPGLSRVVAPRLVPLALSYDPMRSAGRAGEVGELSAAFTSTGRRAASSTSGTTDRDLRRRDFLTAGDLAAGETGAITCRGLGHDRYAKVNDIYPQESDVLRYEGVSKMLVSKYERCGEVVWAVVVPVAPGLASTTAEGDFAGFKVSGSSGFWRLPASREDPQRAPGCVAMKASSRDRRRDPDCRIGGVVGAGMWAPASPGMPRR